MFLASASLLVHDLENKCQPWFLDLSLSYVKKIFFLVIKHQMLDVEAAGCPISLLDYWIRAMKENKN